MWIAAAQADPLNKVRILAVDDYGDVQLPAHARGEWWALCPGETTRLCRVKVKTHPVPNDIGPTSRVTAEPCGEALILLRGGGLSEREVPTATSSETGSGRTRSVGVTLGSEQLSLRLVGPDVGPQYLELKGEKKQRIKVSDKGNDWQPSDWKLVWAGDLDGDGKIDFVTRMIGDGDSVDLYLSGQARGNQLVGPAASTFFGGC